MRVWSISAERESLLPPAWLCVVSLLGHKKCHTVQLLENSIPRLCWNERCVWTAVFTETNTSSKYWPVWNIVGSHSACKLLRQSAALLQFPLPYVWLNKSTLLSPNTSYYQVYEAKQGYICCLQTRSYIIYFFNCLGLCSPLACGVRSLSLLCILVPRQAEGDLSLTDLLQGRLPLVGCVEKSSVVSGGSPAPGCAYQQALERSYFLLSFNEGHLERLQQT